MSAPPLPPPGSSSPGGGKVLLMVLLVVGGLALVCCGGLGIFGALFYTRAEQAIIEAQQSLKQGVRNPPVTNWENDWVAQQALTGAYTAVVDSVAGNPQLIERLGEPMEPVNNESQLFRREQSGNLKPNERFAFDLRGPKGQATIRVDTTTARTVGQQPAKITATFEDGTELELPLPEKRPQ